MRRNKIFDMIMRSRKRHRRSLRQKLIGFVACVIVFCMTYALLLPAIAGRDTTLGELVSSLGDSASTSDTTTEQVTRDDRFEATFADAELTGVWRQDVLSIAESQVGYNESTSNFVIDTENDTHRGYTRFGDWYGDPYGVWDAMFVSFCLSFAKVKDMPLNADCQEWLEELDVTEEEMKEALEDKKNIELPVDRFFKVSDDYEPRLGDLIFFDVGGDGIADRVGLIAELVKDADGEITKIKTIEGNSNGKVKKLEYDITDRTILGFASLPVQPAAFAFSQGSIQVDVTLPEDTEVPRDAVLKVTPIDTDHKSYFDLAKQAKDAVDGDAVKIKLYDISFYTKDGKYISVSDKAQVAIRPGESLGGSSISDVVVLHYDKNDSNPVILSDSAVASKTSAQAEVTFETKGFSTFAVVQVETGAYRAEIIDPETSNNTINQNYHTITGYGNNGKQYVIVSADMKYALSSYAYIDNDGEDKLQGMEVLQSQGTAVGNSVYVNANKHLLWEFENTGETGLIYIKNVATGEYLQLMRAGVALTTELTEGDPDNRQMIHTFEDDDSHKVGFAVNVGGTYYYLNRDAGSQYYHTWTSGFESSRNNQFYLCEYKETVKDLSNNVANPSANIPDPNKVYILAGVNYNSQYAGEANPGKPTILTGEAANAQQIETGANGAKTTLRHMIGEIATNATYQNNAVYFMSHTSQNPYLWLFEETDTENVYNINRMGTGEYLHLDETGLYVAEGKQDITVETVTNLNNRVVQNGVIHLKATLTQDDGTEVTYYAFLNGNDYNANDAKDFTAISSYKGRTEQENNPTTPGAEDASHFVMYEYGTLVDGLEGKAYIISGVNNKQWGNYSENQSRETAAMLTPVVDTANTGLPNGWTGLTSTPNTTQLELTDGAVTNLKIDQDKKASDYAWAFEDVGYGTYYIRSLVNGQYLNIDQHSLTMSATPQVIEVIVADIEGKNDVNVTENLICLRNQENEFVLLYNNQLGNAFTGQLSNPADKLEANRGTELILTEYKATEDNSVLGTDLGGKVYFAVAVNNANEADDNPPWMATTTGENAVGFLTGENRAVDLADGKITLTGDAGDKNNNLGWYFQQTEQPGVYYLVAANNGSTNEGKYLKISAGNNNEGTLTMVENMNDASRIEAVKADTSTIAANAKQRVTENVICLRTTINGEYWYVNLDGNNTGRNFQSYKNDADAVKDGGNHFVLAEIKPVNDLVAKINTLLDNLILEDDGDWVFSEAGYAGSALPGNVNANNNGQKGYGQQGVYGQSHQQPFMDDYDQAQKYRREMQLLAREIRTLYAKLTEEDQRYIWRYEVVDSSGADGYLESNKDLKWLWDTVNVVQPNNPTGVKVNLFNYDGSVNETGLADVNNGDKNGFTFYHKVMYDEYTQIDTGRDNTRNGGTLGSDDSALIMYPTLVDGYPYVAGGRNANGGTNGAVADDAFLIRDEPDEAKTGSLAYLFDPATTVAAEKYTMTDGGGLFQRDADGYYYYYANQNAAWYDASKNQFVLYDTVIRPMYNHGTQPNQVNDVYNFLPFNNPYDDLIFDEYNSIMSNQTGTNYGDKTNTKGEKYVGVAANPANTQRSGYLNERSDMWFGMTIEFDFLMSDDGQLAYYDENGNLIKTTDMIFDFYGDDDVWVYVDDRLVLDIGGVHEAQSGSINFHTGVVTYQDSRADGGVVKTSIGEIFKDKDAILVDNDGDGTKETFADYTPHTLKFFYMERGGNVSYCGLKFNMPILPVNYLMVDKQLAEKEGDTTTDADVIGDQYYTFRVVQADADGKPIDKDGKPTTDTDAMVPFFEEYTQFEVYRGGNPTGNMGMVNEKGYFSIQEGAQAVFSDILKHRANNSVSHYVVQEVFFNEDSGQYELVTYTVSITKPDGTNANEPAKNPVFDNEAIDGLIGNHEIKEVAYTDGVDASNSTTVKFTNVLKPPLGKLKVTKALGAGVDEDDFDDQEFTIKIELGDYAIVEAANSTVAARAVVREVVYSPINKGTKYRLYDKNNNPIKDTVPDEGVAGDAGDNDYDWEVSSSDGTITLKPGQSAVFEGVVSGTWYRISEQLDDGQNWTPTYAGTVADLTIDANGSVIEGTATNLPEFTGGNASGEFGNGDYVHITVTNTNFSVSAEIPLRKKVKNAAFTDTFTFKVENITGAYTLEDAIKAAQGYYELPGTSITVTPQQAAAGVIGKVVLGFSDSSFEGMTVDVGHAYYKISEAKGNGSYVYDDTYYIVGVALNKNEKTAEIIGIWKNGTESVTIPTPDNKNTEAVDPANPLEFTNERTTSVVVDKEVIGGSTVDTFEYNYKVKDPVTQNVIKEGSFTLRHGQSYEITGIPIGAIVEVTEENNDNYKESYQVTGVYEAEYGTVNNSDGADAKVESGYNASNGYYVCQIQGSNGTVTIPVYIGSSAFADFIFGYGQQATRSFYVTANDANGDCLMNGTDPLLAEKYEMYSTGGWYNWDENDAAAEGATLPKGWTYLTIGGDGTSYAPNLDYLKVVFREVVGNAATLNVLGDGSTIHFVNEPRTSITIDKTVVGTNKEGNYTFNVELNDADGNPITEVKTSDGQPRTSENGIYKITLTDGTSITFTDLPYHTTAKVTEISPGTLKTTYEAVSHYEAEEGYIEGGAYIFKDEGVVYSGKGFVGNIRGSTATITFTVNVPVAGEYALRLCYAQNDTRSFGVKINDGEWQTVSGLSNTGAFNSGWKTIDTNFNFVQGDNKIIIGGVDSAYAPNLDYIEIVWAAGSVNTPNEDVELSGIIAGNDPILIHYINETGYVLPATGGVGTHIYTLGGILLMAVPLLYIGCRRKRKRERRAER